MEELFQATTQERFLVLAYQFYRGKKYRTLKCGNFESIWDEGPRHDMIHWLYKLGRDYNVLDMDYLEFERVLTDKHKDYHKGRQYKYRRHRRWIRRWSHNCPPELWRVRRGFTNDGVPKKSKEETPEKAWRKQKRFAKDKNPARRWNRGWKKNLKTFGARKHRRLEREALANDNVDRLGANSYKAAEDPWSWD